MAEFYLVHLFIKKDRLDRSNTISSSLTQDNCLLRLLALPMPTGREVSALTLQLRGGR